MARLHLLEQVQDQQPHIAVMLDTNQLAIQLECVRLMGHGLEQCLSVNVSMILIPSLY